MAELILDPLKSNKLYGLTNYFRKFITLYKKNKLPKVNLISGVKGLGKFTLINHLINYILDEKYYHIENQEINVNSFTYKGIIAKTFSNVIILNKAKIEDIRNLNSNLLKSTLDERPRFIILDNVDTYNLNSLNASLKFLEEPGDKIFFFLINNKENKLLETISSRCLETRIFLKKKEKLDIIKSLSSMHNVNIILDFINSDISPGNFIKFNLLAGDNNIAKNDDHLTRIIKCLNLYKKTKELAFINLSNFFIFLYYYILSTKNKYNIFQLNTDKRNALISINHITNYNLNVNSVINSISKNNYYEQ